jgi:PHD/YefM family antitoxin component YafN of YafNO toxin-antitoxin module
MERAVAIKKLRQMLGNKFAYVINANAPGAEKRQEAYELFKKVNATRDELAKELQARSAAVLAADPEYQRLKERYHTTRQHAEQLGATARHYKIEVGRDEKLFFHVDAQGDSWEEIIAKLKANKKL